MSAKKEVIDKSECNATNQFRELANWCLSNAYKEADPFTQKAPTKIFKNQKAIEKSYRNTPVRPFIQIYSDLSKPEGKKLKQNLLPASAKKKKRFNKAFNHNATPAEAIAAYNKLNAYTSYRKKKVDHKQLQQATARNRSYIKGKTATLCPGKIIKLNINELVEDKDIEKYLVRQTPFYAVKTRPKPTKILNKKKPLLSKKKLITKNIELSRIDIPNRYGNLSKIFNAQETKENSINLNKENQNGSDLNLENQNKSYLKLENQNKSDLKLENQNKSGLNKENQNKSDLKLENQNKSGLNKENQNKSDLNKDNRNKNDLIKKNQNKSDLHEENQNKTDLNEESQNRSNLNKEFYDRGDSHKQNSNKIDLNNVNQNIIQNSIKLEKEPRAKELLKPRQSEVKVISFPVKTNLNILNKKRQGPKEYVIKKKIIPERKPFPVSFLDVGKSVFPTNENSLENTSVKSLIEKCRKNKSMSSLSINKFSDKLKSNNKIRENKMKKIGTKSEVTIIRNVDKNNERSFKQGNKLKSFNTDLQQNHFKSLSLFRSGDKDDDILRKSNRYPNIKIPPKLDNLRAELEKRYTINKL